MKTRIYRGQSLLGLMIAISLSAFLLLVIIQFYSHSQQQNQQWAQRLQLQNELQRVVQLIAKDVRRAGFRAVQEKLTESNFALFEQADGRSWNIAQADSESNNSCLLFLYDLDKNGCVGESYTGDACVKKGKNATARIANELFGYRLHQKMVETRLTYKSSVNDSCTAQNCVQYLQQAACNYGGWVDLLDEKEYEISQLTFETLANNQGIQIRLKGNLKQNKAIQYETYAIAPLFNNRGEK